MVQQLMLAFRFAKARVGTNDTEYPILMKGDVAEGFHDIKEEWDTNFQRRNQQSWPSPSYPAPVPMNDQIIRRLALKAGIVRVHPEAFETIWEFVLRITFHVLSKAATQAQDSTFGPTPDQVILAAKHSRLPITQVCLDFDRPYILPSEEDSNDDSQSDDSDSEGDDHDSESAWSWTDDYDSDVDDDCTLYYDSDA